MYNIRNQDGSTIIILTFLILTAVLGVVLSASKIVQTGLVLDRTQFESTKAYFAAEAGAERVLWGIRNRTNPGTYDIGNHCCGGPPMPATCCLDGNDDPECNIGFSNNFAATSIIDEGVGVCNVDNVEDDNNNEIQSLSNNANYYIEYGFDTPTSTIRITGSFDIVDRRVQLKY